MATASTHRNGGRSSSSRDFGSSIFRDVFSLASTVLGSGKHIGAQKISAVADSTRLFGEDIGELPHLQAYAEAAADGLEDLADYIDRTEITDILDEMAMLARRQPVLTAVVALAAGVAVTQAMRNWRPTTARTRGRKPAKRSKRSGNGRTTH